MLRPVGHAIVATMDSDILHAKHREHLHASGLTDDCIKKMGARTVINRRAMEKLLNGKVYVKAPWIVYPFTEPHDRDTTILHRARGSRGEPKYQQPHGTSVMPYFPPYVEDGRLRDMDQPLIFVEGEKKSAALSQLGYAAIGGTGVSCFADSEQRKAIQPGEPQQLHQLILKHASIAGRECIVLFDADVTRVRDGKQDLMAHAERLGGLIRQAGGIPKIAIIPSEWELKGIDDVLVGRGEEAVDQVIQSAGNFENEDRLVCLKRIDIEDVTADVDSVVMDEDLIDDLLQDGPSEFHGDMLVAARDYADDAEHVSPLILDLPGEKEVWKELGSALGKHLFWLWHKEIGVTPDSIVDKYAPVYHYTRYFHGLVSDMDAEGAFDKSRSQLDKRVRSARTAFLKSRADKMREAAASAALETSDNAATVANRGSGPLSLYKPTRVTDHPVFTGSPVNPNLRFPWGYAVDGMGTVFRVDTKATKEGPVPKRGQDVCQGVMFPYIKWVASTGRHYYTVSVLEDNGWKDRVIQDLDIANANMLGDTLLMDGGTISALQKKVASDYLSKAVYLNRSSMEKRHLVTGMGWHEIDGEWQFIGPGQFSREKVKVLDPEGVELPKNALPGYGDTCGYADKQRVVLRDIWDSCPGTSLVTCIAFSSPLLARIGAPSMFAHLWGESGEGKTATAIIGGTIFGTAGRNTKGEQKSVMSSWNATAASISTRAALLKEFPMFLDDSATLQAFGDPKKAASIAERTVYTICNGMDRSRSEGYGKTLAAQRQWTLAAFSTGESPLVEESAQEGAQTRAMQFRCKELLTVPLEKIIEWSEGMQKNAGHLGVEWIRFLEAVSETEWMDLQAEYDKRRETARQTLGDSAAQQKRAEYYAAISVTETLLNKWIGIGDAKGRTFEILFGSTGSQLRQVVSREDVAFQRVLGWLSYRTTEIWMKREQCSLEEYIRYGQSQESGSSLKNAIAILDTQSEEVLIQATPMKAFLKSEGFSKTEIVNGMLSRGLLRSAGEKSRAAKKVRFGQGNYRCYLLGISPQDLIDELDSQQDDTGGDLINVDF